MLGNSLPRGSEAISFRNTLFRVSELCWIKAVRLSIPEIIVRVAALLAGIAWVFVIKNSKGSYINVEFLLAGFPLILAWSTAGSLKIGCSGDFEETYEARRGMQTSLFTSWIETLRKKEPDWLHLKSSSYDLLLNPHRVAWVRPCFQWKLFPLIVAAVFVGYLKIIGSGFNLEGYPVFDEFQILIFEGSAKSVRMLSYAIIFVAVAAFGLSIKRSVEICGAGGVQDVFPLTGADQAAVLNILAGAEQGQKAKAVKKAPPVAVKPESKKPKAEETKKESEKAIEETIEVAPGQTLDS